MCTNDAGRIKTTENNWIFNEVKPSSVQSNELLRLSFAFSFTYVAKLNRTVNIEPEIEIEGGPNADFELVRWESETIDGWERFLALT